VPLRNCALTPRRCNPNHPGCENRPSILKDVWENSRKSGKKGEVEIRFPFRPSLTQQNGFVHAGAIISILDSACGYAALSVAPLDHDVLSIEFKVNFLSPAVGEEFCHAGDHHGSKAHCVDPDASSGRPGGSPAWVETEGLRADSPGIRQSFAELGRRGLCRYAS
jgi:uncharacterized protein (TIGR00369 family)